MARIRTIKPEMFQDEKLAPCDPTTRLVFLGLIAMADDAGRVLDNVRVIDAFIFPETADSSHEALMRLSGMGRVARGRTASGQRVLQIVNWDRHQKIQHANLRSALPELVEVQEVTSPHEPLMRDARGAHEPLTHHTYDQRPTTNDQRPTTSVSDLFAIDASASSLPVTKRPRRPPAQYPHFPVELCQDLYVLWVSTFGAVEFGYFRKALGPLFLLPESARAPEAPTDAELAAAIKSYVDLAPMGNAARFASVNHAAGCLASIARTRRECADDPARRSDAVMRIIHGAPMRVVS